MQTIFKAAKKILPMAVFSPNSLKPENLEQSGVTPRSSRWRLEINCRDWTLFTGLWRAQHRNLISSYQSFAGISICGKKCGKDILQF
ncbi:hypothetical protein [Eubacterium sp.]|uniref:hypothetical protein n=1 Tax=Eubacterium sp. TaxID=142586 RepID=UPI0011875416|nr:hypothetical protein [Eubacterium sp.]MDO5434597.1 hypothetical protein [Eubacterium sp.]